MREREREGGKGREREGGKEREEEGKGERGKEVEREGRRYSTLVLLKLLNSVTILTLVYDINQEEPLQLQ